MADIDKNAFGIHADNIAKTYWGCEVDASSDVDAFTSPSGENDVRWDEAVNDSVLKRIEKR